MQTFLIDTETYTVTALMLDTKRLGKQRVEAYQILRAIHDPNYGWQNHPAVSMWRNYPNELYSYMQVMCTAWVDRGYVDNLYRRSMDEFPDLTYVSEKPPWITERLIVTHRGALYRKDPVHYNHFERESIEAPRFVCCVDCNYYWPTHEKENV